MYPKSYRWVAEMEELSAYLAGVPGGGEIYAGMARLYADLAQSAKQRGGPGNAIDALQAFLGPGKPTAARCPRPGRTQAIAICATVAPLAVAILRKVSTSARFFAALLASGNAGICAAEIPLRCRRPRRRPLSKPARQHAVGGDADAEFAAGGQNPRPRCRVDSSEYSICRSAIGWTACARRIVSAPISDRPIWRT